MLDAAANSERIQLLGELERKRRLFERLGLLASVITIAGIAVGVPIAVALGVVGIALNVHRVRHLGPYQLLLTEMAPERAAARRAQHLEGTGPLPAATPTLPPAPADGAWMRDHGLGWPLQLTETMAGGSTDGDDLLTFSVAFDDVAAHDFEDEIDQLADYLDGLDGVRNAWREDREFILVETAGPPEEERRRLDAHITWFMRGAMSGCADRAWQA